MTEEEIALRDALFAAIDKMNLAEIKDVAEQKGANVDTWRENGFTALQWACWDRITLQANTSLAIVRYLVETCHVDVTQRCSSRGGVVLGLLTGRLSGAIGGATAFHIAVRWYQLDIVQYLVETRSPCATAKEIAKALCFVPAHSNIAIRRAMRDYLQRSLVRINSSHSPAFLRPWTSLENGSTGASELEEAIPKKDFVQVQDLVEQGANIEAIDEWEKTALLTACRWGGDLAIVQYLILSCQADVNATNFAGDSALLLACESGDLDIVQYLVTSCQANVKATNNNGETVLHRIVNDTNAKIVAYLVETCGLNVGRLSVNATTLDGSTPLHVACFFGNLGVVRYLVERCAADVTIRMPWSYSNRFSRATAFHHAVLGNAIDVARYFVETLGCINARELKQALRCYINQFTSDEMKTFLNEKLALAKSNPTR